jgi:hypothetical protein
MDNNFYFRTDRALLVIPPKCASTSIKQACRIGHEWLTRAEAEAANAELPTIAFARHPWERIISALYSCLFTFEPFATRLQRHIDADDSHVRPQARMIDGLSIDRLVRFENLATEWPSLMAEFGFDALPHLVKRLPDRQQTWQAEPFDWSTLLPAYQGDFALCNGWQQ